MVRKISIDPANTFVIAILLLGGYFRFVAYWDFGLSVANPETLSYIESSRARIFSWDIFAGRRLFTTNLLYKLANDADKCPIPPYSAPAIGEERPREIHPCFDAIVKLQNWLAIISWIFLALIISRWLNTLFAKITAPLIILLFAFTPQIAEWESILSPESLSLSLLAASFGFLVELSLTLAHGKEQIGNKKFRLILVAWFVVYSLWIFIRDVHLYTIVPTVILIALLLFFKSFTKSLPLIIIISFLGGVFVLGYLSAKDGFRATNGPLNHAFDAYIWPYPARVEIMEQYGMPDRDSAEFKTWFGANATKTYAYFLATHPRFVISTLWNHMAEFTSDFIQPYYDAGKLPNRNSLVLIGEMVHPETGAVFLIDSLLLLVLIFVAIKSKRALSMAWCWLAIWLFAVAITSLLPSFFGDVGGTHRHIFPSIELLRLFMWVFLIQQMDALLTMQGVESSEKYNSHEDGLKA